MDKIKAAIARLQRANGDTSNVKEYCIDLEVWVRDLAIFARHMCDPAPLTTEVLQTKDWYEDTPGVWTHADRSLYLICNHGVWNVFVDVYDLGNITTVGEFNRLLSGLGSIDT